MKTTTINFLTAIKIAAYAGKETVSVRITRDILEISVFFYKMGVLQSFFIPETNKGYIVVTLRYFFGINSFANLKMMSTPSKKIYLSYSSICSIPKKGQTLILATDIGYLTCTECKQFKKGGKLCFII
jgi:ribosomal protein S8